MLVQSLFGLLVLLVAIVGLWLLPYDPNQQDIANLLQPPSREHLFGTDNYGRDIFSRVIAAARLDLQIGVIGVLLPWIIGVVLGLVAGYAGGLVESVIMRVLDTVAAFPFLVLVIGIIAILGPGVVNMYVGLTLVGWTAYARIVRGEVLVLRRLDFIAAARNLGYSESRIMFRHVLGNVVSAAIVFAMSDYVRRRAGRSVARRGLRVTETQRRKDAKDLCTPLSMLVHNQCAESSPLH